MQVGLLLWEPACRRLTMPGTIAGKAGSHGEVVGFSF